MNAPGLRTLLAALLVGVCTLSQAHRFHAGITDIRYSQNTGNTEIIHTYMAHDVEALLAHLHQRQFDLSQPEGEAAVRQYVEQRFYLQAKDKSRLPLRWVGMSADAQSVVIYQEVANTPLSKTARIHHAVLVDFKPDQLNTVNLIDAGATRTFRFDHGHPVRDVR